MGRQIIHKSDTEPTMKTSSRVKDMRSHPTHHGGRVARV